MISQLDLTQKTVPRIDWNILLFNHRVDSLTVQEGVKLWCMYLPFKMAVRGTCFMKTNTIFIFLKKNTTTGMCVVAVTVI